MKDFYYILGTDANSTAVEINEAYGKLSAKFHPELNQHDPYFESRFAEIREAYEVLSNPDRRSRYDKEFKKLKAYARDEKHRIKRYHSSSKGLNTALTLVLLALAFVFGHYVFKLLDGTKPTPAPVVQTAAVNPVPVQPLKHHKRKHWTKLKAANFQAKTKVDSVKVHPAVKPSPAAKPAAVQPAVPAPVVNHVVAAASNSYVSHSIPAMPDRPAVSKSTATYTTYIKANETGLVKLRKNEDYYGEVIGEIPDESLVTVLQKGRFYYKIQFDGMTGFVPKWTVQGR